MVQRLPTNPILSPADLEPTHPDLEALCAFNPGAVLVGDEIILFVRVAERPIPEKGYISTTVVNVEAGRHEVVRLSVDDPDVDCSDPRLTLYKGKTLLTSLSHIRLARSRDGKSFTFDPEPFIYPSQPYETFGCEDARVVYLEGRYCITYSAISVWGICLVLAVSEDMITAEKRGIVFPTHNKDMCIFPERVRGRYVCRHRPESSTFNQANMWTAYSPDLLNWGQHALTIQPLSNTWQSERVGCGAPPIKTDDGWLEIYHGANHDGRYCLGAMLSDLEEPEKVLTRSSQPVLQPETDYEKTGLYGNCVFSNGIVAAPDGTLTIYYGAADSVCAAAVTTVDEMIGAAKR